MTGTGPIGCVPAELALRSRDGNCDPELMRAASLFNPQLVQIINELNSEVGSGVFVAANAYQMHFDYISNPQAFGEYPNLDIISTVLFRSNISTMQIRNDQNKQN